MKIRKILGILVVITAFILIGKEANAQLPAKFSLAGGVIGGYHIPQIKELNAEMRKIGVPEFSESGFITTGGGGMVDLGDLRLSFSKTGYTSEEVSPTVAGIIKKARYGVSLNQISGEYIKKLSGTIDFSAGGAFTFGLQEIDLYQNSSSYGNWNNFIGEIGSNGSSQDLERSISSRYYALQPQIGIGAHLTNFLYLRLQTGYILSLKSDWQDETGTKIINVPDGIKADGFNVNLGLYLGLFVQ